MESKLQGLESLPSELQRSFHHMRDLDQQAQDLMRNIDKSSDDYLKDVSRLSPSKRSEQMNAILGMFNRAKEFSDDKVHLAVQTYELVDKHIRRLDSDLAKFEAEVKEKPLLQTISKDEEEQPKKKGRKKKDEGSGGGRSMAGVKQQKKKKRAGASSDAEESSQALAPANNKKKKKSKASKEDGSGSSGSTGVSSLMASVMPGLSAMVHPTGMDMPVDPNEPTYCLCHQVSYGEMIACDKTDCPIEWFHFACVNLTTKPKGKWYCPRCAADTKKKK